MLSHIVVPLDGSAFAEQVVPLALHLADLHHAELELVHVFEALAPYEVQGAPPIDPAFDTEMRRERQKYLERIAERLAGSSGLQIQARTVDGADVPATLAAHLAEQHADLVILAKHTRGGLGKLWLGSVLSGVLGHTDTPVMLVPAHDSADEPRRWFRKVLMPLDGTSMDEQAVDDALAVVVPNEAEFVLLSVREPVASFEQDALTPNDRPETDEPKTAVLDTYAASTIEGGMNDHLESIARGIRSRGFRASAEVITDHSPAKAILTVAEQWEVDLIVVETHATEGITRLLHPRVVDKVIRGSRVPVLAHRHSTGASLGVKHSVAQEMP